MDTEALDITRSRGREAGKLLKSCRDRAVSLSCESCGTTYVRSGAWLETHPTFMCGRCFQDVTLTLSAILGQPDQPDARAPPAPRVLAQAQEPLRGLRRHWPM